MNEFDYLVDDAYIKLKILFRHYKKNRKSVTMTMLLVGEKNYCVRTNYSSPHNYQAVVASVHKYYEEIRDNDLITFYNEGLKGVVDFISSKYMLQEIIDMFDFELFLEKCGDASFNADMRKVLFEFSKGLVDLSKSLRENDEDFDEWLINKRKYFCRSNKEYAF